MFNGNGIQTESPAVISHNIHQSREKKSKNKGPYILGATLGEGAFAKVKVATQTQTKEKVAIKILNKSRLFVDENDILRIKKEIKILKKLRHKNIIQLYEVLESKKSLYIVMEYCERGELFDYIVKKRKISEMEACHLFQQIINGVEYLHEQNIIHRDLKPENLLLDNNLRIKISDFGLSTFFSSENLLQTPCGTPSYAPPEMLKGKEYNGTFSDIWSCGIILYAMLCGALPFSESKEDVICRKIMAHDYVIPGYVSKDAQDLLNHILKINPKERFDIKMIKSHQWFNMTTPKFKPGLMIGIEKLPIDEVILNLVEQYGFDKEKCRSNLNNNIFDSITCVYYLCLQKHIAQGGRSISDVNSDLFEEYIINQRYIKERQANDSSSSDSEIIDNINEEYDVNDNEGNEFENQMKESSNNNLRYLQPVLLGNSNNNPCRPRENSYSINKPHRGMTQVNDIKSFNNNPNGQSIRYTSKTIIEPIDNNNTASLINNNIINTYSCIAANNQYKSSNSTKSRSQNGKIGKIRAEHNIPSQKQVNGLSGNNNNGQGNYLSKLSTQACNSSNTNATNITTLTSVANTNSNNASNYPVYSSLNKSKTKQLPQTQTPTQSQSHQSKQTIPLTQAKKLSCKVTPLQSNAKDQTAVSMETNTMMKKKINELSSSVGLASQKDCTSFTSPNKNSQVKAINSNRQSFVSAKHNNTTTTKTQTISSLQREKYKKNRNEAKENNSKFQHKSNPCPNELLNLIDKDDDDDAFSLNDNKKNVNVIDIISKRLMEKSSFFGSFQFPSTSCDNQKFLPNFKDGKNPLILTMDNYKNKSSNANYLTPSQMINGLPQCSSIEKDNSLFFNVISLFNKSYKNKLTKDFKDESPNTNAVNEIMNANNEYSSKTTIKKTLLSKMNKEKVKPIYSNDTALSNFHSTWSSNKAKHNYNIIIPLAKKYQNEALSTNSGSQFKRNQIIEEEEEKRLGTISHKENSTHTRHYNKFLDISTNYDPGLDSRGESSVERSVSIKSDLKNISISPERKKPFSVSNKQLITISTLNNSFSGNKSTTSLKALNNNNNIGVISEDDEFKLTESNLRNVKRQKNHYHNIEKKATINLSVNINDTIASGKRKI